MENYFRNYKFTKVYKDCKTDYRMPHQIIGNIYDNVAHGMVQRWLTLALVGVGGQSHASVASPSGKRPGTHSTGGWVGRSVGLDGCGKSRPHQNSILGPSSP